MKKLSVFVILLLIVTMLAIPALAAQTATMTVKASATTVHRGNTITVTVSTSAVNNCTSGGFMFTYDKNVFEYVSGSAVLTGYTSGVSTAAGNVAGYFMNGNATVQGNIFQINLKVKDNAAFGNYTISGTPSLTASDGAVTCSATGATVTVACNHTYGGWTKVNDTTHKHVCSGCSKEETANHTWNSGTVTKPTSCKAPGEKTFTCTTCNATKTEPVAKTENHNYGSWTKVNDTTHKHTCSVCQKEETANHTWNSGTVTKPASCKETGEKTYTCTGCNATKTEAIAKTTDHKYGNWSKVSDTTHKHTCSVCSKEETANHIWNSGSITKKATCKEEGIKTYTCTACNATKTEKIAKLTTHTYDHACDTDCNVCGATRTTTHHYKTSWSKDKDSHWYECSVCKEKKDSAAHIPGAEATETTAQTCTACGYVLKAALGHTHDYASAWTTDENGHWYACSGCEEKDSYADHDFENACDRDCSVCGYTRETEHKFAETWATDANNHWHECTGCGLKQDEAAHEPGAAATATTAQVCTVCHYEIAPALGGETAEPTEPTEGTDAPATEPTVVPNEDPGDGEDGSFPWWVIAVVAVVAIGGVVATVVIKKKK